MKIVAEIEYVELTTDTEKVIPGVLAECEKCGHCTESYGQGPASVKRCLALLREECPEEEENYYVSSEDNGP